MNGRGKGGNGREEKRWMMEVNFETIKLMSSRMLLVPVPEDTVWRIKRRLIITVRQSQKSALSETMKSEN